MKTVLQPSGRQGVAHGASRGIIRRNDQAPKERKNPRDPSSDKVGNSKEYERIQPAEAAIPECLEKLKLTQPQFDAYALGWDVSDYRGTRIISHAGAVFVFRDLGHVLIRADTTHKPDHKRTAP